MIGSLTATFGSSLKCSQIRDHCLQIICRHGIGRHPSARLDALWIENPARQRAWSIWQRLGRKHPPAGDMRKVWAQTGPGIRAAYRVTHEAGMGQENLATAHRFRIWWISRGFQLLLLPFLKFGDRLSNNLEPHVGVLQPAKFCALAVINPGFIDLKPERRRVTRQ